MKNILVDSTIWIEFFHERKKSIEADLLQELITEENNILICPVIYQEVLQGVREDKIFKEIKSILLNALMINTEIMYVTEHAIDLCRFLRKKGITIRKQYDCLIASYAILNDVYLFHDDSDFDQIEKYCKLKVYKYKT
ncbi:MAG: PIN domain-containing protein [Treponema sp.]|jgi:predicted nucleic acid-binding protein|nr:PIN domain-containing protein [Treponema sp.]